MMPMTFGTGMSMAVPDVCKTPPFAVPVPYPNMGNNAMAIPTYFTIMINAMPELNIGSMYAITNGDEAGAMGGVASQIIVGMGRPTLGSQMYFVGGMPSWRLTAPTIHNLANAPGITAVPGQFVKVVMR